MFCHPSAPSAEQHAHSVRLEGVGVSQPSCQRCRTAAESQQRKFVLAQPAPLEEIDAFISGEYGLVAGDGFEPPTFGL